MVMTTLREHRFLVSMVTHPGSFTVMNAMYWHTVTALAIVKEYYFPWKCENERHN